jgi:outer membrane protein assembly factor BamB
MEEARKRLVEKKTAEAISLLRSVIDTSGNELVVVSAGRSVRARHLAHAAIARLDAKGLALYRDKVDPQAKKWLEEAGATDGVDLLRRVVDEAFCSTQARSALDQLGDRAFERGDFAEAESWWGLLAPLEPLKLADADADTLFYPDLPEELVVRCRAKQLLVRLFVGTPEWKADLAAFRKRHPKAAGSLAGQTATYADILQAVADARANLRVRQKDWRTFAGNGERGKVVPVPPRFLEHLSRLCRPGATWRFDLEERARRIGDFPALKPAETAAAARRLAFHPVVVGHRALVADARHITAYDLRTGKSETWYDVSKDFGGMRPNLTLPTPLLDLRYTLTVSGPFLFARLGTQTIRDVRGPRRTDDAESALVCLGLEPGKTGHRFRWMVRAIDVARKEYAVFEGAPLVHDGRVYIAATRLEADRAITAIHCYPAEVEDSSPAPLWRTDICETHETPPAPAVRGIPAPPAQRSRHHLLTLAGTNVVYCSHSGAVVAVDARQGTRSWALRYPRREKRELGDDPDLRDLAPCLYAGGKVYVAPSDCESLFCLDPTTGATIWQRERLDVVHLLGVGQGRLIFTTWRNPRQGKLHAGGLRAVGADDGSDHTGWSLPDDGGGLAPFGRGLLVGDLVLWPTARQPYGVFAVRQKDGQQPDNPALLHRLPAGNLVYANGCLLVADQQTLHAFVPPEMLDEESDKAAANLSTPLPLRRARAAAARGENEEALKQLAIAESGLDATSPVQIRRRVLTAIRRERQDAYLRGAAKAIAEKDAREAEAWLRKAREGQSPRDKLAALLEEARLWHEAGDAKRMRSASKAVLEDQRLRVLTVDDASGLPQSASTIARLPFKIKLERADEALIDLGLARTWEEEDARSGARWLWQQIQRDYADVTDPKSDPKQKLGALAEAALRRLKTIPATFPLLPLANENEVQLNPEERWLVPRSAEGRSASRIWSVRGTTLVSRSREGREPTWTQALPFVPEWMSGFGSLMVLAGSDGITVRTVRPGAPLWIFLAPQQGRYPGTLGGSVRVVRHVRPSQPLHDFHLAGGRLFALQGERRLLALDLISGRVLWQHWAPGAAFEMPAPRGRFQVVVPVGDDTLLVQASGRRWLLESATGKIRKEAPAPLSPWPRTPRVIDDRYVCLVNDSSSVEMIDAVAAKMLWSWRLAGKTTRSGEPPLVVPGGEDLFVIVPENIGYRLYRLDVKTGRFLWSRPQLLPLAALEPGAWAAGPDALYHADAGKLWSRSRTDGSVLWQRPLSAPGAWKLDRIGETLVARVQRGNGVRFRFRWLAASVQWTVGPLTGDALPCVELIDARTGSLLQRINLEDATLHAQTRLESARSGVWPEAELGQEWGAATGVAVWWDGKALLAGLGNRVKVLAGQTHPEK